MIRRTATRLRKADPRYLILRLPLLAGLVGLALLLGLGLATPAYVALLAAVVAFDLLALWGPARWRPGLLAVAAEVYALLLLAVWLCALYLLPRHPATPMLLVASVLHITTVYVFFFLQHAPRPAALRAALTLLAFLASAGPHSWQTLRQLGPFDGVSLPLTLLLSHGALILTLMSFSRARHQLARARVRAQTLYELAHRDPLTNLHNRRKLEQDLARAVERRQLGWVLAIVDVDGLKGVNDSLGHAAGDDLLRRFAGGFARVVQPQGWAYRLSGDEFALLLSGSPETATRMVRDVVQEVRVSYRQAGASVGTAQWQDGETPSAWLSRADRAMYRHKKRTAETATRRR